MQTPVALFIFNRPDLTEQVFAAIAGARPPVLFLVADGPRAPEEETLCARTRAVVERVDWPCEVYRNYADVNLGLGRRITSGLDWAFEHCDELIYLEDDTLPDPTFFPFCDELLARYRDDPRVMLITGTAFPPARRAIPDSYTFSHFPTTWGWASWRRVWRLYDFHLSRWPALRDTPWLASVTASKRIEAVYRRRFDAVVAGTTPNWSYQLDFACLYHGGYAIVPRVNLISNIGFDERSTSLRFRDSRHRRAHRPTVAMPFPLRHPSRVAWNRKADRLIYIDKYGDPCLNRLRRVRIRLVKLVPRPLRLWLKARLGREKGA